MTSPTAPEQFTQLVLHQVTNPHLGGLVVQAQPAGLGQITVSVHELAGLLHVHVVVEQAQALQWFHAQHQGLMENLANSGHDVTQMTFSMANDFRNSGQQGRAPQPTAYRAEGKSISGAESVRVSGRTVTSEYSDGRWYV